MWEALTGPGLCVHVTALEVVGQIAYLLLLGGVY